MHLRAIAGGRETSGIAGETRRHANVERLLNGDLRGVIDTHERNAICGALPTLAPMDDKRRTRVREHVLELYSGFHLNRFSEVYERVVEIAIDHATHPEHLREHIQTFTQKLNDGYAVRRSHLHPRREAFLKAVYVSILVLP